MPAVALDASTDRVAVAALRSAGVRVADRFATGEVQCRTVRSGGERVAGGSAAVLGRWFGTGRAH